MDRVTQQIPHVDAGAPVETVCAHPGTAGCLVVDGLVAGAELAALRHGLKGLMEAGHTGGTSFDGLSTRRVFDPFARSRCLDRTALQPTVFAAARDHLGACRLGMTVVSEVLPGQSAQALHRDAGVYPLPAGTGPVMVTAIWAIDAFTASNGATRVAVASHLDPARAADRTCVPAEMDSGSVLLLEGRTVHGAGANRTAGPRLGVILEYVASWLRPPDNHTLAVPPETIALLPSALQELLGYNQRSAYHGFVAGRHPREWLAARTAAGSGAPSSDR
jgi:ectoine hydroxylase-related dioxygenase (phytanoyl-CoA dioxygenase family)